MPTDQTGPADPAGPASQPADLDSVRRSVEIDAPAEDVWEVVSDPDRRSAWLDDDDALARVTRIDHVESGRFLAWTWWHPDDADTASQVEVTLDELAPGNTRVTVVEQRPHPAGRTGNPSARASTPSTAGEAATGMAAVGRATVSVWNYRLLGLELLFVAARVCV